VASTAQTVTVTNSGNANLVINAGGASIGGANAGDFSKSADTCSGTTVAAGSNCTVSIRFTPGAAGARTASLSIASNAAGSNSVALSGTGVVPVVPTTITLSATALGLGGRRFAVGNTSTAVVTITNARRGNPLQISPAIQIGPGANPQMTGANASEFFDQS